jgi:acetate CoA/acetoacetate CoA-transferase beta subunit
MGGAMDLMAAAKKVIVVTTHTNKGAPKILKNCTLPYGALDAVDMIITEMGVMEITPDGIMLTELHPDYTIKQVQAATGARLIISPKLKAMETEQVTGNK